MRHTSLAFVVFTLAACDEDATSLDKVCTAKTCWIDEKGLAVGGAPERLSFAGDSTCKLGQPLCTDGEVVGCEGWVGPSEEECDGFDNDCNYATDDGLTILWHAAGNPCPSQEEGICRTSNFVCVSGMSFCEPILDIGPEVCDGLDNDCNGLVDDGLEAQFYYPEDLWPGTMGIGECDAGIITCQNGVEVNYPPDLPSEEQCGTNRDEDCDGSIDEDEDGFSDGDFAIAIDISGSMTDEIYAVQDAVCTWAIDPYFEQARFAVLLIGDGTEADPFVSIIQDFDDVVTTCDTLSVDFRDMPSQEEYQLSAVVLAQALSWGPNTLDRNLVVFTDEAVHFSYPEEYGEAEATCLEHDFEVGVFGDFNHIDDWNPMIGTCGGFTDTLDNDADGMFEKIHAHFYGKC